MILAFLWLVGCVTTVLVALIAPDTVWEAVVWRIRNPRPSPLAEYMSARRCPRCEWFDQQNALDDETQP